MSSIAVTPKNFRKSRKIEKSLEKSVERNKFIIHKPFWFFFSQFSFDSLRLQSFVVNAKAKLYARLCMCIKF